MPLHVHILLAGSHTMGGKDEAYVSRSSTGRLRYLLSEEGGHLSPEFAYFRCEMPTHVPILLADSPSSGGKDEA